MPKLSRLEIDEALEDYRQAEQAINEADPDFIESAIYQHKAAESRVNALIRQAKDNVIQFPLARIEPEEEPQPTSWQEKAFDLVGLGIVVLVSVAWAGFLVYQGGRVLRLW